ncbi:MAG: 50S ribosomal protein L15 [Calditrichaeota bacterium]|nr:50S ribosomal protein L15 [Calditrichota bacterium]MCB9472272.1 50S ribosomal protein L15 [Candidatus Delongbacteria bacterium]
MNLGSLKYADGSRKKRKRIARGTGSGHGGTATRGHKGQMSRSGAKHRAWFEGGQMPIQRRLPKRGFTNIFREENQVVSLGQLDALAGAGVSITPELLLEHGVISHINKPIKVLSNGELTKAVKVEGLKVSASARERIESAGGSIA